MATNLWSKLAKSDHSPLFVALEFRNGLQYRHSDFKKFICDYLAALCKNVVTPEFKKMKGVHPVVSFFKINLSNKLSQDPPD